MPLKLWAKFDETTGFVAADSSGNGYHGTVSPTAVDQWGPGKIGNCFIGDGTTKNVGSFPATVTMAHSFSGSFWLKFSTLPAVMYEVLFKGSGPNGGGSVYTAVYINTLGKIVYRHRTDGSALTSVNAYNDGQWHHVVFIKDVSILKLKLYVDKIYQGMVGAVDSAAWSIYPYWFCRAPDGYYFPGSIDQFKLYDDQILSQEEIDALYNEGNAKHGAPVSLLINGGGF